MTNSKSTKRALLTSSLAMLMCVAMLIGTTFAWFTDTASTAVNKIQSGTLKVGLQMQTDTGSWTDAEGQTLNFKKASTASGTDVLWEPGCTYELPAIRVVNEGNLAFKYKLVVSGAIGDTKLLEAIEFTVVDSEGNETAMTDMEGIILPEGKTPTAGADEKVKYSDANGITIKGHMKKEAGNEYQNLSVSGIAVTVYAEQYTYEYDSYDKMYDEQAEGIATSSPFTNYVNVTTTKATGTDTVLKDNEISPTITATIPASSTDATSLTLIKKPTANPGNITIATTDSMISADVKIIDQDKNVVTAASGTFFKIEVQLGANLEVLNFYHDGVKLANVDRATALTEVDKYYYDVNAGTVTFTTDDFSVFSAEYKYAGGLGTEEKPYLIATAEQLKVASETESGKYLKLVSDIALLNIVTEEQSKGKYQVPQITITKNITLDLNGKTISVDNSNADSYGEATPVLFTVTGKDALFTINDSSSAGTGTINCEEPKGNQIYGISIMENAKLIINGGNFYGAMTVAQVTTPGPIEINGGFFDMAPTCKKAVPNYSKYIINCIDKYYTQGKTIRIKGGTFVNFNPSDNPEGKGTSYVANGYQVVSKPQTNNDVWNTVVAAE